MHREHSLLRQDAVEEGERRLLDLAGVRRAADQHEAAVEVQDDEGFGARAVELGNGVKVRRVQDGWRRLVRLERVRVRLKQQVAREEAVPHGLGDDPDEDIPGLMKTMTMTFAVADRAILEDVSSGQPIDFRLEKEGGRYVITEIEISG